jgi:hypothetical protein
MIALDPSMVIDLWSKIYGYTVDQIKEPDRQFDIRVARQVLSYSLKRYTSLSFPNVGIIVNRTHCNVIHSCKKVTDTYLKDKVVCMKLRDLLHELDALSGRINTNTLNVMITRFDLHRLMPDLTESEKGWPMLQLWERYMSNVS